LKADDAENKEDDIDIGDNVLSMMLREVETLTLLSQGHDAFFRTTQGFFSLYFLFWSSRVSKFPFMIFLKWKST
jgi:hypothetical protein